MKKKTLLISGIGLFLILIAIVLAFILPKPVRVGYEEIPVDVNSTPKMRMTRFTNYIENTEDLRNALDKIYENPTQAEKEAMLSSDPLKKYDDKFFEKNFLYVSTMGSKFNRSIMGGPLLKVKRSYLTNEKKLIVEVKSISEAEPYKPIKPNDKAPMVELSPQPHSYVPRGYLIEIPRKQFEKYRLDYDDIEITYLNSEDIIFNVQVGRGAGRYNPKFPISEYATKAILKEEPRPFGLPEPE